MPRFQITGPDGASYEVNAPEGANENQVLEFAKQQFAANKPSVTAPSNGVLMGFRDAIDAGSQMLRRAVPEAIAKPIDELGAWLDRKGLPVASTQGVQGVDQLVKDVNQKYEANRQNEAPGQDPGFDGARLVGNIAQPANWMGGGAAAGANTLRQLATAGARAGAVSGALQPVVEDTENFWMQKAGQTAAGAAGGAVLAPAAAKSGEAVAKAVQRAKPAVKVNPTTIDVQVTNILRAQGLDRTVPQEILDSVQRQVTESMQSGQKLLPGAIVRRAQFEAVGLTDDAAPTLGQLTRDPMQWANEKNLSGVRLATPQGEGNPLATRFQAQNNKLQEVFDGVGANSATDRVTAGQTLMNALRDADQPVKAAVDDAYTSARNMAGGRAVELDRGTFSQSANAALDEGMWGRFVPSDVRALLNDVSSGKTPFTVEASEQIDGILAAAQRKAGGGTPQHSAIGVIRSALRDTPFAQSANDVVGVAIDEGAAAREAFSQARTAARKRFATIEQTPALKAALNEEAPDDFVRKFVLGAKTDDLAAMKRLLENSPEALTQARAQIAAHLKGAAFGPNAAGDGAFAPDRYMRTLQALGPKRLEVFFNPTEMVRLNLAGKVAADITSKPAGAAYAANSSGTGAALMNILSKISEAPLLRQLPGARALANQVGEIRTEHEISRALAAQPSVQSPRPSAEVLSKVQRLLAPAGMVGGVLAGAE
ncbi:hypothetical protein B9Z34_09530 [Limnohabitans sp. Hippo3]|nr:hypothetical protein B9Z34_09530 [Limnohabitans sp. Hippo3]